jgi:hypothetical protein
MMAGAGPLSGPLALVLVLVAGVYVALAIVHAVDWLDDREGDDDDHA